MLTTRNNIPTEQINLNRLIFLLELEALQGIKVIPNHRKWIVKILKECKMLKGKCA